MEVGAECCIACGSSNLIRVYVHSLRTQTLCFKANRDTDITLNRVRNCALNEISIMWKILFKQDTYRLSYWHAYAYKSI